MIKKLKVTGKIPSLSLHLGENLFISEAWCLSFFFFFFPLHFATFFLLCQKIISVSDNSYLFIPTDKQSLDNAK